MTEVRESAATRAVMAELAREVGMWSSAGESFDMSDLPTYRDQAMRWLKQHSELSTRVIEGADYAVALTHYRMWTGWSPAADLEKREKKEMISVDMPAQLRKHAARLNGATKGERELTEACSRAVEAMREAGRSPNEGGTVQLTNAALGAALTVARGWLNSKNGNEMRAAKSLLSRHEMDYVPDDPREIRHEVKLPKSLSELMRRSFSHGQLRGRDDLLAELTAMSWTEAGAKGRVTVDGLRWLLDRARHFEGHDHPAVKRAATTFVQRYTPDHERTSKLVDAYLAAGDEHQDQEQQSPTEPERVVLVACGGAKAALDRAAAGDMYVGSYHRACRRAAEALTKDGGTVLILSARYGLLPLDQEIETYDVRAGEPGAMQPDALRDQAASMGLTDARVTVLGGSAYVELARSVWPQAEAPLNGGIGDQLQQLASIYGGDPEPLDETPETMPTAAPMKWYTGPLREVGGLPTRYQPRLHRMWFGGKAGRKGKAPGPWRRVEVTYTGDSVYELADLETGEVLLNAKLSTRIHWAALPGNWEVAQEVEAELVADEDQDDEPELPTKAGKSSRPLRQVPENFLYIAEEADTEAARAWWRRRCEQYARGEV